MSDNLAAFLLARIAEDEQAVQTIVDVEPTGASLLIHDRPIHTWISEHPSQESWEMARRVLAECEAKRRIIELHCARTVAIPDYEVHELICSMCSCPHASSVGADEYEPFPCRTLRLLVLPYADQPDYRAEWQRL